MVVLVCAYALVLALIVSVVVALGQLAVLVPSYASEIEDYVQDVGGWLDRRGDGRATRSLPRRTPSTRAGWWIW